MNAVIKSIQLIIGMTIGLMFLGAAASGAVYYFFITQVNTRPPKPVFAEERAGVKPVAKKPNPKSNLAVKPNQPQVIKKDPNVIEQLPAEAYDAKVIWKDGLSLKKEPKPGSEKLGGVAVNEQVAIIKTSDDQQWLLIRSATNNLQGWVKAGNIARSATATQPKANKVKAKPTSSPSLKPRNN
jgi:hypothetical protein